MKKKEEQKPTAPQQGADNGSQPEFDTVTFERQFRDAAVGQSNDDLRSARDYAQEQLNENPTRRDAQIVVAVVEEILTARLLNRAVQPGQVKVRALQALAEDGQFHDKGAEFETSEARANALGGLVQRINGKEQ